MVGCGGVGVCTCVYACVCARERGRERKAFSDKNFTSLICISDSCSRALIPFYSPIGEVFRSRLRQFPSLVNCCTIDWFSEWPDEALCSVATSFMQDITEIDISNTVKGLVSLSVCLFVCLSVCLFCHASLYTVKVLGRRRRIECVCMFVWGVYPSTLSI